MHQKYYSLKTTSDTKTYSLRVDTKAIELPIPPKSSNILTDDEARLEKQRRNAPVGVTVAQ